MIKYEEFGNKIAAAVEELLGTSYKVRLVQVPDTNNIMQYKLVIFSFQTGNEIYYDFEDLYARFGILPGDTGLNKAIDEIKRYHQELNKNVSDQTDPFAYDNLKDKIMPKLINTEQNKELLKKIPSIPFLDLSIVFYILWHQNEDSMLTAQIQNNHLFFWNISVESLYKTALENVVKQFPSVFNSLYGDGPLWYLGTEAKMYGAVTMLYPGIMKDCAEKIGGDFLILPSSIHEVLLVKADEDLVSQDINHMIQSINNSDVEPEDVLSDHAYRYDSNIDKIIEVR